MFYSTPSMQSGVFLPGTLVQNGSGWNIKKPNGNFLTVLHNGTDSENVQALDQELFFKDSLDSHIFIADRTIYPEGQSYTIIVVGQ